ncbi:Nucleotide-binding protein [Trichinella spiralis]|uniref:Nucleotide-binding protein n=1 Tax=Trichinella spiralis TaxID=6334 RepID=A0ABR3KD85_TRISP
MKQFIIIILLSSINCVSSECGQDIFSSLVVVYKPMVKVILWSLHYLALLKIRKKAIWLDMQLGIHLVMMPKPHWMPEHNKFLCQTAISV